MFSDKWCLRPLYSEAISLYRIIYYIDIHTLCQDQKTYTMFCIYENVFVYIETLIRTSDVVPRLFRPCNLQ